MATDDTAACASAVAAAAASAASVPSNIASGHPFRFQSTRPCASPFWDRTIAFFGPLILIVFVSRFSLRSSLLSPGGRPFSLPSRPSGTEPSLFSLLSSLFPLLSLLLFSQIPLRDCHFDLCIRPSTARQTASTLCGSLALRKSSCGSCVSCGSCGSCGRVSRVARVARGSGIAPPALVARVVRVGRVARVGVWVLLVVLLGGVDLIDISVSIGQD